MYERVLWTGRVRFFHDNFLQFYYFSKIRLFLGELSQLILHIIILVLYNDFLCRSNMEWWTWGVTWTCVFRACSARVHWWPPRTVRPPRRSPCLAFVTLWSGAWWHKGRSTRKSRTPDQRAAVPWPPVRKIKKEFLTDVKN